MANLLNLMIVPGFGSSELLAPIVPRAVGPLWYDIKKILALTPACLQLANDGQSPVITPPGALSPGGGDTFGVYGRLVNFLQQADFDVTLFGWDWRKDLFWNANRLANSLALNYQQGNFYVLTHSTGGLLAQVAYPLWKALNSPATWSSTTYLACPHGGTYQAISGLNLLPIKGHPVYIFIDAVLQAVIRGLAAGKPQKVINQLLQACVASWPALIQLGPNTSGPWAPLDPNAPAAYKVANYAIGNPSVTQGRLDFATAFQANLVALYGQPRPPETSYAGTGSPTLTALATGTGLYAQSGYTQTNEGDGTVPLNRALLPNGHALTGPWTHMGIVADAGVLEGLPTTITQPLSASASIPAPPQRNLLPQTTQPPIRVPQPTGINNAPGVNNLSKIDP